MSLINNTTDGFNKFYLKVDSNKDHNEASRLKAYNVKTKETTMHLAVEGVIFFAALVQKEYEGSKYNVYQFKLVDENKNLYILESSESSNFSRTALNRMSSIERLEKVRISAYLNEFEMDGKQFSNISASVKVNGEAAKLMYGKDEIPRLVEIKSKRGGKVTYNSEDRDIFFEETVLKHVVSNLVATSPDQAYKIALQSAPKEHFADDESDFDVESGFDEEPPFDVESDDESVNKELAKDASELPI